MTRTFSMLSRTGCSLVSIVCTAALPAWAGAQPATGAEVVSATVHPDGARLAVRLGGRCVDGTAELRLDDVPPVFDPRSVTAIAETGVAEVLDSRLVPRPLTEAPGADLRADEAERTRLLLQRELVTGQHDDAQSDAARAAEALAALPPVVGREAATSQKNTIPAWGQSLDQLRAATLDARARIRTAEQQLTELDRRLEVIGNTVATDALRRQRRVDTLTVRVRCNSDTSTARALVWIQTTQAGWTPRYQARHTGDRLRFEVGATVVQRTGWAWDHTTVSLATHPLYRDVHAPEMQRLWIGAAPASSTRVLVRRDEEVSQLAPTDAAPPAENQGSGAVWPVAQKVDLAGDGTPHSVKVASVDLAAQVTLYALPRALPAVVRRLQTTWSGPVDLPAGSVDLFSEGASLGKIRLGHTARGSPLSWAVGVVPGIQLDFLAIDDGRVEGRTLGGHTLHVRSRLQLTARTDQTQPITVEETLPVSEAADVTVEVDKATTPGWSRDPVQGRLRWTVQLKTGQTTTIEVAAHADVPGHYALGD